MQRHIRPFAGAAVVILLTSPYACARHGSTSEPYPFPQPSAAPADTGQRDTTGRRLRAEQAGDVAMNAPPYSGAFGPATPTGHAPAPQRPIAPWVTEALGVLYSRPSPDGPPPIAIASPKAIWVVGSGPVVEATPGPAVFGDRLPPNVRTAMPDRGPFSNTTRRARGGSIRLVAFDRTLNDTKRSADSMALELSFTDADGAEWRVEQAMLAPLSPNPIVEPWFGGLAIDTVYHGETGNGTPAEPKVRCAMCSWGWADVYRNGERVASSAPLHIMVTSDVRDAQRDFAYACYDCTNRPVREVHVLIAPSAHLPTPGGFLHVMWENAEIRRGTPDAIARAAPPLAEDVPTIELSAVPYLKWDRTEIPVKAKQRYRLVLHNDDPTAFHQFHLHSEAEGGEHRKGSDSLRHDEGGTAGGIGPLWQPDGGPGHEEDMAGPRHVFVPLPQGSTWATFIEFDKPGEYEFMCPVGNHHYRGMEGKFVVSAADSGGAGRGSATTHADTRHVRVRKEVRP